MQILPPALSDLIDAFGSLPGVGPRTAERYSYYLLRHEPAQAAVLADKIKNLSGSIGYCEKTFALVPKGQKLSDLYTDPRRNKKVIAVVAEPFDIVALERTNEFSGTYHVLGGLVSPIDGIHPENLNISALIKRINEDKVEEVILALNASVEGESTSLYIQSQIKKPGVRVTRLARGLPIGVDLEYADQITLTRALENRTEI
ncbi:MAG TPA: recombination mediator RecR [Candidatus Sulfotelmatobacter sp.]|nr:recombination mediator RecR [Candidatus Sulfotelmatobacter sp.]